MTDTNFLELLSDQAATPDPAFISSLQSSVVAAAATSASAGGNSSSSTNGGAILGAIIAALVLAASVWAVIGGSDSAEPTNTTTAETAASSEISPATEPSVLAVNKENDEEESEEPPSSSRDTGETNVIISTSNNDLPKDPKKLPPDPDREEPAQDFQISFWNVAEIPWPPEIPTASADYSVKSASLDIDWDTVHASGIQEDYFVMHATIDRLLPVGIYEIHFSWDEGAKLYADTDLIFDNWDSPPSGNSKTESTAELDVNTESVVVFTIEYYDSIGSSELEFELISK